MNTLRCHFGLMACLISAALGSHALAQRALNTNGTPVHMIVTVEPRKGSEVPVVNREDVMVTKEKTATRSRNGFQPRETMRDWNSLS